MNLAIVGTSKIAETYIRSFKSLNINISTIYSREIQRAKRIAEKFDIAKPTTDLDSILNDISIDCGIIVTEPNRHIDIAEKFVLNNKNILIEKPIDINLVKVENFISKYKNSNLTVQVASQFYFDPIIENFKKKLRSQNSLDMGIMAINIFYNKKKKYFLEGNQWRKKYSNPIINQGIHWFDFMIDIFGKCQSEKSIKENIFKYGDNYDNIFSILKFKNNKFVHLSASTNLKYKKNFFNYTSLNLDFSYNKQFYSKLLTNPINYFKFKSSYRNYLQCKNFIHCVTNHTNDNSLMRSFESLKLINKILK